MVGGGGGGGGGGCTNLHWKETYAPLCDLGSALSALRVLGKGRLAFEGGLPGRGLGGAPAARGGARRAARSAH